MGFDFCIEFPMIFIENRSTKVTGVSSSRAVPRPLRIDETESTILEIGGNSAPVNGSGYAPFFILSAQCSKKIKSELFFRKF